MCPRNKPRQTLDCPHCTYTSTPQTQRRHNSIGVRANIHVGVKPSFARMANTKYLHAALPGRTNNELLQCLVFDGRRTPPLLPHPNVCQVDGYLFHSMTQLGLMVSQTNVVSFARINIVSARILGGQLPPDPPHPVRPCTIGMYHIIGS